jgi:two-component system, chemotaxis family, protein-glutamate methylesterase/glutaminase
VLSGNVTAFSVPATNVIVVGASAGGISAVRTLLNKLPENVPAAIFVVVHTSPDGPGKLASVLDRATRLTVVTAEDGMVARHGHVYVAPPDYHLIVDGRYVRLTRGPREHRFRPAVDPLFRTAAEHYGARAIGVVLSGHMADGTHGLTLIKEAGGLAIVQDPDEALAPSMPLNAMRRGGVDYVLPVEEMARVIMGLIMNERDRRARKSPKTRPRKTEAPNPERPGADALRTHDFKGPLSPFTCPDCGGTLWEIKEKNLVRYRCHVGHGFNSESLRDGMDEKLEDTLWTALRAIEENIELRSRMKVRATDQRLTAFSGSLDQQIADMKQRATALRRLLLDPREHAPTRSLRTRKRQSHG